MQRCTFHAPSSAASKGCPLPLSLRGAQTRWCAPYWWPDLRAAPIHHNHHKDKQTEARDYAASVPAEYLHSYMRVLSTNIVCTHLHTEQPTLWQNYSRHLRWTDGQYTPADCVPSVTAFGIGYHQTWSHCWACTNIASMFKDTAGGKQEYANNSPHPKSKITFTRSRSDLACVSEWITHPVSSLCCTITGRLFMMSGLIRETREHTSGL